MKNNILKLILTTAVVTPLVAFDGNEGVQNSYARRTLESVSELPKEVVISALNADISIAEMQAMTPDEKTALIEIFLNLN